MHAGKKTIRATVFCIILLSLIGTLRAATRSTSRTTHVRTISESISMGDAVSQVSNSQLYDYATKSARRFFSEHKQEIQEMGVDASVLTEQSLEKALRSIKLLEAFISRQAQDEPQNVCVSIELTKLYLVVGDIDKTINSWKATVAFYNKCSIDNQELLKFNRDLLSKEISEKIFSTVWKKFIRYADRAHRGGFTNNFFGTRSEEGKRRLHNLEKSLNRWFELECEQSAYWLFQAYYMQGYVYTQMSKPASALVAYNNARIAYEKIDTQDQMNCTEIFNHVLEGTVTLNKVLWQKKMGYRICAGALCLGILWLYVKYR